LKSSPSLSLVSIVMLKAGVVLKVALLREQAVHDADATLPHHSHYSRICNGQQVVAMEPLSIDNGYYLDYSDAQNIKFFIKG
jgi:hypothetical protein